MKKIKKLCLSTITISMIDSNKFQGGSESKTPKCITLTPLPPTAPKLTDGAPACPNVPSPWQ